MACDLDSLVEDSKCLDCLSKSEKLSAAISYFALSLDALDGEDLTDINALREAVACWCVGGQRLDSFQAQTAINLAVSSGALAEAPTIAEVRERIKCYNCDVGGEEKKAMLTLLVCSLFENLSP